jgi:diguanylate cyclase (GGDEF)-like protein
MDTPDFPALRDLIKRLPMPLVLFDSRSGAFQANDRFADAFPPEQLDGAHLQRLVHHPRDAGQAAKLRRRDGSELVTRVQTVAVADAVLLAFDEAGSAAAMQENERLRARIAELESMSATDPLTGAWNRLHLERMIDVEISRAKRSGLPVSLILLDIDHFKQVNDVHGHLTGDAVLKEFVDRIRERIRDSDLLFRWGGDEFVVLATSVGYRGGAALAKGLCQIITARPFAKVGPITVSLGVTEYMKGESAEKWFRRTDQALYAAKDAGRNRMHIDRQGSSDLDTGRPGKGGRRPCLLDTYECAEPAITAEYRKLRDLVDARIAAAVK